MTMAAKQKQTCCRARNSGQSLVELAIILPIFVTMFYFLINVDTAISMAIVYQKYSRGTLYYMIFNHRYYPEINTLWGRNGHMGRYWIGVDDKVHQAGQEGDEEAHDIFPRASTQLIGGKNIQAKDDEQIKAEYPDIQTRKNVRIRVITFMCVPPLLLNPKLLNTEGNLGDSAFLAGNITYCQD